MKAPRITNHREHFYFGTEGTVYYGTIQVPHKLFNACITLMQNTEHWDETYNISLAKRLLAEDIERIEHSTLAIRVTPTKELVRLLNLKGYKQQNYVIKLT